MAFCVNGGITLKRESTGPKSLARSRLIFLDGSQPPTMHQNPCPKLYLNQYRRPKNSSSSILKYASMIQLWVFHVVPVDIGLNLEENLTTTSSRSVDTFPPRKALIPNMRDFYFRSGDGRQSIVMLPSDPKGSG